MITTDEFASEKILDKEKMLQAHYMLNSEAIKVSIPKRDLLLICSDQANEEVTHKFYALHEEFLSNSNTHEYLSDLIFVFKEGVLDYAMYKEDE